MIDLVVVHGERKPLKEVTNLIHSTIREANKLLDRDVGRPYYGLNERAQLQWNSSVSRLIECGPATPEMCHREWQAIYIKAGWKYGTFSRRRKRHPALLDWNDKDFDNTERDVFLTMATQLQNIYKENRT